VCARTCADVYGAFSIGTVRESTCGGGVAINYAEKLRSMEERAPLKY